MPSPLRRTAQWLAPVCIESGRIPQWKATGGSERDGHRRPDGQGARGLPEPVRGGGSPGVRGVGGDVRLPRPLRRGSARVRGRPVLVPGRAARRGARLPVRLVCLRVRRGRAEPGELPTLRGPAFARRRVPTPQRLRLHQPERGHRRDDTRQPRRAVLGTGRPLLRALERAVRAMA
jgi:hypothetical protein